MRGVRTALFLILLSGWRAGAADAIVNSPLNPAPRSVSSSKQFVIYYQDRKIRALLALKAEDIKSEFLQRLALTDSWQFPIIIRLNTIRLASNPRISTQIFESDGNEFKVQVDLYEPTVVQSAEFDIEILRALCLEYAYRKSSLKAGKAFSQPPAWLLEGLYEDAKSREKGLAAGLYSSLLDRGSPPKIESFLRIKPWMLDATSRAIYRAQALGLLRGLLGLPGGATSLTEYLSRLPDLDATDAKPLIASFPSLASDPAQLSKLWILSMADASASDRIVPLDAVETKKQLDEILNLSAPRDPKNPDAPVARGPAAMPAIARSKEGAYVLGQKAEDLMRLEMRSHPMIRPMVEEYRLIASELTIKPKRKMDERIAKNTELVNAVVTRGNEVADYMNWYEAAKLETPSGEFTAMPAQAPATVAPRTDPVTSYLDDFEARGW